MTQPSLFDLTNMVFQPEANITDRFEAFHQANPWVYRWLVNEARRLHQAGHTRIGIGMLFEVLRWDWMRQTVAGDFKLNNNYRSRYARLIMEQERDLAGVFETRMLRAA